MSDTALFALTVCIFGPIMFWVLLALRYRGQDFRLDFNMPNNVGWTFMEVFAIYQRIAWVVASLSFLTAITALLTGCGAAAIFAGFGACYIAMFVAWLAFCYESYLHQRYRDCHTQEDIVNTVARSGGYTGEKYALTVTLAIYGMLCSFIGIITLAASTVQR